SRSLSNRSPCFSNRSLTAFGLRSLCLLSPQAVKSHHFGGVELRQILFETLRLVSQNKSHLDQQRANVRERRSLGLLKIVELILKSGNPLCLLIAQTKHRTENDIAGRHVIDHETLEGLRSFPTNLVTKTHFENSDYQSLCGHLGSVQARE